LGDDSEPKEFTKGLITNFGFEHIDLGGLLTGGRLQQAGGPVAGRDLVDFASEAIQPEQPPYRGEAWTEIVRRPTLDEFSHAFGPDVVWEASVVRRPVVEPIGLWAFFQATRAMYERIGFSHEMGTKARMCLKWERVFAGKPWPASPSLHETTAGRSRACDYIIPFDRVVAFAETISRHLG
jgi:hypothetical protein